MPDITRWVRTAAVGWILSAAGIPVGASAASAEDASTIRYSESSVRVIHETVDIGVDFDHFTVRLEHLLGRYDPSVNVLFTKDPSLAIERMKAMEGADRLMIFAAQNHGTLLAIAGKSMKARRYHLGNPLIALEMTRNQIAAGLYAPLTILVDETGPSSVRVEFDDPSSLFGQFDDVAVTAIAVRLDGSLRDVIEKAALRDDRQAEDH
ncbi:DUF302 domain-containing protein [Paraburkholderia sp. GAS42]|jgi:hypothetical protein|uniref:DUF302 domain-containing protein n=1 Tax=Paraburkholderia sp. GAS42 TaxID=3035135 RepID=UPI003D24F783